MNELCIILSAQKYCHVYMNDLIITKAVKEDLPIILDIQRKAFLEVAKTFNLQSMPQIEQTLESLTDEFKNCTILKASLANTPAIKHGNTITDEPNNFKLKPMKSLASRLRTLKGTSGNDVDDITIVGSVRAYKKNDTCYINRLVVLPEYQNQGIGKALMNAIENQFQDNVTRYELFTGAQDPRNLYLYNQLGYKTFKTEKHNHGYEPQASIGKSFRSKLWSFIPSALRDNSTCKLQCTLFLKLGSHYNNQFRYASPGILRSSLSELEFHNKISFVYMEKSAQDRG
jgi:ribosomal protein S18 acetylase RimI-like enzyme